MVQRHGTGPGQAVAVAKYLGLGLTLALSTGLFMFAGSHADEWLGTGPWLTLIGAFIGAAGGFYNMYYHLVIEPRDRASKGDASKRDASDPSKREGKSG